MLLIVATEMSKQEFSPRPFLRNAKCFLLVATYWEISCSFGLRKLMFSWYQYLIVGLVFSHLGFWSGDLFLIAPYPDLCQLVPFFHHNANSFLIDLSIIMQIVFS